MMFKCLQITQFANLATTPVLIVLVGIFFLALIANWEPKITDQ